MKIFREVKNVKPPAGFETYDRFVVNPLTICSYVVGWQYWERNYLLNYTSFYCLFRQTIRHNIEVSHTILIQFLFQLKLHRFKWLNINISIQFNLLILVLFSFICKFVDMKIINILKTPYTYVGLPVVMGLELGWLVSFLVAR